jgi:two-component system cell cycle sensor histidine kinase/response regulator CckA
VSTAESPGNLFERAPVPLVHVAADGRIAAANTAFARLVGGHPSQFAKRDLSSLITVPALGGEVADALASAPAGTSFAAMLQRADGRPLAVDVISEGGDGGPEGFVITVSEAFSALGPVGPEPDLVGLIAGGVAHHLNNYLSTVVMNSALLAPRIASLPPDNGDFLSEINSAASHAAALIRRLLAFSRETPVPMRTLALGPHLEALVGRLEAELPPSITLVCADRLAPPGTVRTNTASLDRILTRLVANAREAMPAGGHVEIACEEMIHELHDGSSWAEVPAGRYVVVSVSDTGTGMEQEVKARLFEPFFTTKPDGQGPGLGLAVVFGLVRRLGGHVTVDAPLGEGTTVRVWIPSDARAFQRAGPPRAVEPAQRVSRPSGVAVPAEAEPPGRRAVLLVEDEVALRVAAQKILERLGYPVYSAGSGERALRLFHAHEASVALVITDLMMPGLGGRGLFEALRAQGSRVPVVFTSGLVSADMREREGLDPAVPFLEKPWEVPELLRVVRELAGPPPEDLS